MSLLDESGQRAVSYAYDDFGKTDIKPAAGNTDRRGETNEICSIRAAFTTGQRSSTI